MMLVEKVHEPNTIGKDILDVLLDGSLILKMAIQFSLVYNHLEFLQNYKFTDEEPLMKFIMQVFSYITKESNI